MMRAMLWTMVLFSPGDRTNKHVFTRFRSPTSYFTSPAKDENKKAWSPPPPPLSRAVPSLPPSQNPIDRNPSLISRSLLTTSTLSHLLASLSSSSPSSPSLFSPPYLISPTAISSSSPPRYFRSGLESAELEGGGEKGTSATTTGDPLRTRRALRSFFEDGDLEEEEEIREERSAERDLVGFGGGVPGEVVSATRPIFARGFWPGVKREGDLCLCVGGEVGGGKSSKRGPA